MGSEYRYFAYSDDSRRRVCSQQKGKSEYQIKTGGGWYRRLDGLRRYFDAHNVIPSKEFYELIKYLNGNLGW